MTANSAISRKTEVISISLPPTLVEQLEKLRERFGQSRSAFIAFLINRYSEDSRWNAIYEKGARTARKFSIKSEEDIDRILHEA